MAATIKIKNSSTAGAAPTSSDLVQGELAVNVTDKRLYTENASGTVVELGTNPSVPVTFPDGSASAPSLTNDGDTNTGMFFPAADTVGITTGGTERARVDSSGNLGLGLTPSAWISSIKAVQLNASGFVSSYSSGTNQNINIGSNSYVDSSAVDRYIVSTYATTYQQYQGQHKFFTAASGTAGNAITFTQAMTLDASGNLGIGTTSPSTRLHVAGATTATSQVTTQHTGSSITTVFGCDGGIDAGAVYVTTNHPLAFKTNNTERARIDSSGNFGIGTTTPSNKLQVAGNVRGTAFYVDGGAYIGSAGSDSLTFIAGSSERARIDSSGNLLVGTTTAPNATFICRSNFRGVQVENAADTSKWRQMVFANNSADAVLYFPNGTNTPTLSAAGAWTNASDGRQKTNITDINYGLDTVLASQPHSYNRTDVEGNYLGFVAQELKTLIPEVVFGSDDTSYSVDYGSLVAVAFKAIQEQQAIITQLQADVAALKG